jgi:UDP-3-O-[3-hydroxymyristoyl] N-acetylglucosamine deacetylase
MFYATQTRTTTQHTTGTSIAYHGIGPFDGRTVAVNLRPAGPGTGIRFVRTDVAGECSIIRADWQNFIDARLGTVLGNKHGVTVTYAENVLTPLRQCGIDNAIVELNGAEVPRPDGGYASMHVLIERAGIVAQHAPPPGIWVENRIEKHDDVADRSREARAGLSR